MTLSRRPAPSLVSTLALLLAVLLLGSACGHKKPPIPPPSKVPQRVVLQVHQRGQQAVLSFPLPTTTISGTALPGISKVEVYQYSMAVPEFALEMIAEEATQRKEAKKLLDDLGLPLWAPPVAITDGATGSPAAPTAPDAPSASTAETADAVKAEAETPDPEGAEPSATGEDAGTQGEETPLTPEEELAVRVEAARALLQAPPTPRSSFITATLKDFVKDSELVQTVVGDEIASALIGDKVVLRLTLPPRPSEGPEIGHLFAAQVYSLNGKPSDLSERVAILPSETIAPPQDVTVAADATGIILNWSAEEDPPAGFRVYRRNAQTRLYGDPVAVLPTGTERLYVDRQAVFGARYIYGMTAVESTQPLLESDLSSEHEIDYQDRFGPNTPSGLVAFPETGRVRLLWTDVGAADLAGYEILRRAPSAEAPNPLNSELATGSQYVDTTVASGEVWFYSVVAVDTSGNRSQVSAETEVRIP